MRTRLQAPYQPLYADLVKVESLLKDISITELPPDKTLKELRQTGALQRVPSALKGRLDKEFKKATETHMAALAVHEIVIREMSLADHENSNRRS